MKIEITYSLIGNTEKHKLVLSGEQYFDSPIADEIPEFDHAWQYLDIPKSQLTFTKLIVETQSEKRIVHTKFFADGDGDLIHVSTDEPYEELILSTPISEEIIHISRIHKTLNNHWELNTNSIITNRSDGNETEHILK
jgi:hypothetical protein